MKQIVLAFLIIICNQSCNNVKTHATTEQKTNHTQAEAEIKQVLEQQTKAWNSHDLEGFMQGYWNSPDLKFYGSNGLILGWQATLERYQKNYPTNTESGTLNFVINDISPIENNTYWVIGEYHLKRDIGNADGVFIIIFKNIQGKWKIIADMSC